MHFLKNNWKIASLFVLAIFFTPLTIAQADSNYQLIKFLDINSCQAMNNRYIATGSRELIFCIPMDTASRHTVKKVKFKGEHLKTSKSRGSYATVVHSKKAGDAKLNVILIKKNKEQIVVTTLYKVVTLPDVDVEIAVTDPASKFMWLNLIDKNSGQNLNADFYLCKIEFELKRSDGELKEQGVSSQGDEFFPSVTLQKLPTHFELNDRLKLTMMVMHTAYDLPVYITKELVIDKLWH